MLPIELNYWRLFPVLVLGGSFSAAFRAVADGCAVRLCGLVGTQAEGGLIRKQNLIQASSNLNGYARAGLSDALGKPMILVLEETNPERNAQFSSLVRCSLFSNGHK